MRADTYRIKNCQFLLEQSNLFYFGYAKRTSIDSCRGAIAIVSIFFLITNKKELGLTDIFKKENKKRNSRNLLPQ